MFRSRQKSLLGNFIGKLSTSRHEFVMDIDLVSPPLPEPTFETDATEKTMAAAGRVTTTGDRPRTISLCLSQTETTALGSGANFSETSTFTIGAT